MFHKDAFAGPALTGTAGGSYSADLDLLSVIRVRGGEEGEEKGLSLIHI